MQNDVKEYDIEVFTNYFEVGIKDFRTKEVVNLEISEEFDQREEIYNFFSSYDGYLISFNGIHYDNVVIKYFLSEWKFLNTLSWKQLTLNLKHFSDKVINQEICWDQISKYVWLKANWVDIDLFCYWSKMLRLSKKISLKSLGIQLGYPVVQELPFEPGMILKTDQIAIIRNYNNIHDLGILDLLAERMREDIKLRISIRDEYKLDCLSWDAIRIASEALLQDYCKETEKDPNIIRKIRFDKSTIYIGELLRDFNPNFKLPIFQKLYQDICNSIDSFSKELVVIHNNTSIRLSYGVGGLHSINENEIYVSTKTHKIITSDFASLYPNLIINYLCIRFPEVLKRYKTIKAERLIAKKEKKKVKDTFLKLILNGVSGLLDQNVSWLYYPEGALRLRLIGQLILTKVVEICIINNWQVISVNTDGIEVIIPTQEVSRYYEEVIQVEKDFNLQLEHEVYNKIVYTNVNNYICQTESGKLKKKGFYKTKEEIPLGDSTNELIIAKALEQYFIYNIPIINTIISDKNHIYDYCCSKKISKDYEVFYNNQKVQNLNRYYFSRPAPLLFKKKKDKVNGILENVNAGSPILLFNEFQEKDLKEYKIDYLHYLSKTREIINLIEQKQDQLSLF